MESRKVKKGSAIVKFFLWLVMLGVGGVAGYFTYQYFFDSPKPDEGVVTPNLPSEHVVKMVQPVQDSDDKSATKVALYASQIRAALDSARSLYDEGKFKEAVEALANIPEIDFDFIGGDARVADLLEEVSSIRDRSTLFAELVEEFRQNELSPTDCMAFVRLLNGEVFEGVLLQETQDKVRLRMKNGITSTFARSEIERIDRLTFSEWRQIAKENIRKKLEQSPPTSSEALLELAEECFGYGVQEMVPRILEKALAMDADMGKNLREKKAKRLYDLYLWYQAQGVERLAEKSLAELREKYGDTKYALETLKDGFAAPTHEGSIEEDMPPDPCFGASIPEESMPDFLSPEVARLVSQANAKYEEGLRHLERSSPHSAAGNLENQKALEAFKEACALYEQALELEPKNSWIQKRLNQTSQLRYMCFKRATLK